VDSEAPIGIFDSGFGGLTVARAVIDQLPNEDIVYLGDTARAPYGEQPIPQVREYALECLDHLLDQGVKALVIACNSASAAVLRDARERYPVPVVEVILPAARRAVAATRSGRVGVICTEATATSQAYDDAFAAAPHLELFSAACPRFVEFVEAGVTSGDELLAVAEEYLAPLRDAEVDTLVLGCTHYPFLKGAISYVMGEQVALVSSDVETANDVYRVLVSNGMERRSPAPATYRYEATGTSTSAFLDLAHRLIAPEIPSVELVATGALTIPDHLSARARAGLRQEHA
jgi:glutamate racemase